MADDFPLLDLHEAWQAAHRRLQDVIDQAERLWRASAYLSLDMLIVRQRAVHARAALGAMPPTLLKEIAKARAGISTGAEGDFDE